MKITLNKILFAAAALALAWRAYPSTSEKQARLRLNAPVEQPNGVHFSWLGGQADASYSIYRRAAAPGAAWERIAMGLTGVSGTFYYPMFTLDQDYSYRIQAETP